MKQITFPFDKHDNHVCQVRFTVRSFVNDWFSTILSLNNEVPQHLSNKFEFGTNSPKEIGNITQVDVFKQYFKCY